MLLATQNADGTTVAAPPDLPSFGELTDLIGLPEIQDLEQRFSGWHSPDADRGSGAYRAPMEVWFNPSCRKCRSVRERLDDAGVQYTLRRYLDDPPNEAELREALTMLGLEPWDITRMSEPLADELGLHAMPKDADAWLSLLAGHPQLIQRPLVLTPDGRAWVARDDETLTEVVAAGRLSMDREVPARSMTDGPCPGLVAPTA